MALIRNPPVTRKPIFSYSENLHFLRLYIDDLDDVMRVLRDRAEVVVLGAGSATAEEPTDLRGATSDELNGVTIRTENPAIRVWLHQKRASVDTGDSGENSKALVRDVTNMLRQRNAPFGSYLWRRSVWTGILGLIILACGLFSVTNEPQSIALNVLLIVMGLLTGPFLVWINWRASRQAGSVQILLKSRAEARTDRSSAKVIAWTAIGSAFVGGLATAIASILFTKSSTGN